MAKGCSGSGDKMKAPAKGEKGAADGAKGKSGKKM
jgi:hypothetical protein